MKENQINKIVKLYIIFSIFYSLIGRVIPIKQLIGEGVNSLIYILLAGIGALLLLVDLFTTKKWYKGKYIIVLYSFVVIIGISSLINIKYGFSDNLKTIVWTTIQIGLIYTFYTRFSREELIRFFDKMWVAMSTFWFFPVIISLVQFVICKGYITKVEGRRLRQGFYDNRLFGLFNDPNYAAITSLCMIVAMLYLLKKVTNKKMRIFFKVNIVVQYIYVVLSGSRTALVCMTLITGFYVFMYCYQKIHGKYNWKRVLGIILIPVVSMSIVVVAFTVVQRICVVFPMTYYYVVNGEKDSHIKISDKEEIDATLTERKDGKQGNVSNNRVTIWKSYIEGLKGDVLLGGSPRNALAKWQEKEPNGYLAVTGYETHNGYVYVLAGTGVIGMLTIVIFMILYARKMILYMKGNYHIPPEVMFNFIFLIIVLIDVCFFTELFFVQGIITILFWLHCGYTLCWIDAPKKNREKNKL